MFYMKAQTDVGGVTEYTMLDPAQVCNELRDLPQDQPAAVTMDAWGKQAIITKTETGFVCFLTNGTDEHDVGIIGGDPNKARLRAQQELRRWDGMPDA